MGRVLPYLLGAAALLAISSVAGATTLLDQTNLPNQSGTSTSLDFTAGSTSTILDLAGFDVPSWIYLTDIRLTLSGQTTNLLGQDFTFTGAPSGSDASVIGLGVYGTDNLAFGGVAAGSYDHFSQTITTIAGSSYHLTFNLSSYGSPNGLLISASNAISAVPEPATWTMMLLGFGAMGIALRRSAKRTAGAQLA